MGEKSKIVSIVLTMVEVLEFEFAQQSDQNHKIVVGQISIEASALDNLC